MWVECLGEPVDTFANRRKRNDDGKEKCAGAGECRLGVGSGIVRLVNPGICKKGGHTQKHSRGPSVGKVSRVLGESDAQGRESSQQPGLRSDRQMRQCEPGDVALDHEQQADCSCFDRLVTAEYQPVLMLLMHNFADSHGVKRSPAQRARSTGRAAVGTIEWESQNWSRRNPAARHR